MYIITICAPLGGGGGGEVVLGNLREDTALKGVRKE